MHFYNSCYCGSGVIVIFVIDMKVNDNHIFLFGISIYDTKNDVFIDAKKARFNAEKTEIYFSDDWKVKGCEYTKRPVGEFHIEKANDYPSDWSTTPIINL